MIITNRTDISLEMAVWLLHDEYDYVEDEHYISATGLMKPIRHILLPARIPEDKRIIPDVEDFIARALGSTLHAGIERAWKNGNHKLALRKLGYPPSVIDRVLVNPTQEEIEAVKDPILVWIEQRAIREIGGYRVGGKFDLVCEGRVTDTKSTSVYAWLLGGKDEDYILQGSIYRWLHPDKITEDHMRINFIFTDWKKMDAKRDPKYPQSRIQHKDLPLMSIEDTEKWILTKLAQVDQFRATPERNLPACTEKELWFPDPKFKYYADPAKAQQPGARSTKNFDSKMEAHAFMAEKGKGVVLEIRGSPKRCEYCAAFPICSQKDQYFQKDEEE